MLAKTLETRLIGIIKGDYPLVNSFIAVAVACALGWLLSVLGSVPTLIRRGC